jgi:hypothetical protein
MVGAWRGVGTGQGRGVGIEVEAGAHGVGVGAGQGRGAMAMRSGRRRRPWGGDGDGDLGAATASTGSLVASMSSASSGGKWSMKTEKFLSPAYIHRALVSVRGTNRDKRGGIGPGLFHQPGPIYPFCSG